ALESYLSSRSEGPLHDAYDVGRKAIGQGMGVLHITALHHESLATILRQIPTPEQSAVATRTAGVVEAESLSVFEMALRGYREANTQLRSLNGALQAQTEELARSKAELEKTVEAEHRARVDLEKTHEELKKTQSQLVHSAKLAALGQLVGGVAHEINNPLAIVSNNLAILQIETQSLAQLVVLYRQAHDLLQRHRPDLMQQVTELTERIDLNYLLEHQGRMIDRSRENLKRIQQIVKDLRDFGRAEQSVFEVVSDLNSGIAATLHILHGIALKRGIELK